MGVNAVINKSLRFLKIRSGATGNSAFAQLGALNTLVDQINNMIPYRMYDIMISQTGSVVQPVLVKLASGATECPHSCDCKLYNCDCKCGDENGITATPFLTVVNTGTGVFTFTFNVPETYLSKQDNPLKHVSLVFSALPVAGFVSAVPDALSPNILTVTTYDSTGAPANYIFDQTIVQARLYFTVQ